MPKGKVQRIDDYDSYHGIMDEYVMGDIQPILRAEVNDGRGRSGFVELYKSRLGRNEYFMYTHQHTADRLLLHNLVIISTKKLALEQFHISVKILEEIAKRYL